jgi:hypothetical protein
MVSIDPEKMRVWLFCCPFLGSWSVHSQEEGHSMTNRRPFILTTNPHTAQVQFFDGETYDVLATVKTIPQPHEIYLSADKTLAYISIAYRAGWYGFDVGKGHELIVLDLQQRKIAEVIDLSPDFGPHGLALDEQRGLLYITCESRGGDAGDG